ADVVAAIGEGHACDGPRADLLAGNLGVVLVIVVIVSAPGLPRGPETEAQRNESEVRDGCRRQEGPGADGHQDSGTEDAGESEVLTGQNAGGGAPLPRPSSEEEGKHDDVVDVGCYEQAHRLQDRGEDHAPSPAASHPGTEQAGSMHGAS